jgi:hypothetical protein
MERLALAVGIATVVAVPVSLIGRWLKKKGERLERRGRDASRR